MTFKVSILDQLIKHNQPIAPVENTSDTLETTTVVSNLKNFLNSRATNVLSEVVLPKEPEPGTATALLESEARPRSIWDQIQQQTNSARQTVEEADTTVTRESNAEQVTLRTPRSPHYSSYSLSQRANISYQDIAPPVTDRVISLETEVVAGTQTTPNPVTNNTRTLFGGQVVISD